MQHPLYKPYFRQQMSATYQSILQDLQHGKYAPIYLLDGEEPFFIDQISDFIEAHALDEAGKAFDQVVLYGREVSVATVLDEAKRYPMIGNRRVVIVKEAQLLKNLDEILPYAKNPMPNNVLVLAHKYKKMDGKKAVTKYLRQHFTYFESKKLYDNQISGWVENHVRGLGRKIEPKAAVLLAEFVGTDLSRLHNELEKLLFIVPISESISAQHIETNIGISKDYNNFELINALASKDVLKANKIIKYFGDNPKASPATVMTALLYTFFSKLLIAQTCQDRSPQGLASALKVNPYFTKDYSGALRHYNIQKNARIIGYLREFDMRSKGKNNASASEYELMRELVFKILH